MSSTRLAQAAVRRHRPLTCGLGLAAGNRFVREELGDLAERAQRAQVLGLDRRRLGQAVLHGREDLDSLDRVDAQVRVKLHVELEHVHRVARLLGHHLQQGLGHGRDR